MRYRRSIRLPDYDYTQSGAYFVTICTHQRQSCFGEIRNSIMCLSRQGQVAHEEWQHTAELRPYVVLDAFVVMPNHIHGILFIVDADTDSVDTINTENDGSVGANTTNAENDGSVEANTTNAENDGSVGAWCTKPLPHTPPVQRTTPLSRTTPLPPQKRQFAQPIARSLGTIVGAYKAAVTRQINRLQHTRGISIWQRNYWERIIRSEDECNKLRRYILTNPARWQHDTLYLSVTETKDTNS